MRVHQVAVQLLDVMVLVVVRGLAVLADLNVLVGVEVVVAYLLMASFDNRLDYTDLDMNTSFYRFKISTGLILRPAQGYTNRLARPLTVPGSVMLNRS